MPEITEEDFQEFFVAQDEEDSEQDSLLESVTNLASEMESDQMD